MANLMVTDEVKPIMDVKTSEKRVRESIPAQIYSGEGIQKCEGGGSSRGNTSERRFSLHHHRRIEMESGDDAAAARGAERNGQVESLPKRQQNRRFFEYFCGPADDALFDRSHVRADFPRRPASPAGPCEPAVAGHFRRRGKIKRFGFFQVGKNFRGIFHLF